MIPTNIKELAENRLTEIKEEFENNYEIYFKETDFINYHDGSSYEGFWSWTDGSLVLNVDLYSNYMISSGNYPIYLQKYINHIENLAHEYAIAINDDTDSGEYYEKYDEYLLDDYITLQFRFLWYDKNNHGNGKNKIYCDCFLVDEYNKVINKEIVGNFNDTIQEIEFNNLSDIDIIFNKMLEVLRNKEIRE